MIHLRFLLLHACALIIAAGVAAGLSQIFAGGEKLFVPAFFVALGHAVVLGVPTYWLVRQRRCFAWWIAPLCGFAIGALPLGFLSIVTTADQESVGHVATVVNGVYTLQGWLEYLHLVGSAGLLGAAGGLAFGLTIRSTLPKAAAEGKAGWTWWDILPVILASASVVLVYWIPILTEDRSCHNPLRGGRTTIPNQINAELAIDYLDWPELVELMRRFAHARGWSYRDYVRIDDPNFMWLQINICSAEGTGFEAMNAGPGRTIYLDVYQMQGGTSSQPPFAALYRELAARWPSQIRFRDDRGEYVAPPAWLGQSATKP